MSDRMRPIPFEQMLDWTLSEYQKQGSVFGVSRLVRYPAGEALPIFHERIESPFGPAAGPNSQLAQNIIAAYAAGARFFELKTVQQMDGPELASCVAKPCIASGDECYNCEWSTELTVPQAYAEYVKAWVTCRIIAKEFGLGDPDGFVFNMSVGYDLEGIRSPKVDTFIEGMKNAAGSDIFQNAIETAVRFAREGRFSRVSADSVRAIPARISDSITESTLHGCPPDEIERIATYLIREKNLNTYIKCNPTLLGYDFARKTLDELGFDYVAFDDHHFQEDLQWEDAVPMLRRLMKLAEQQGTEFGVKLTNTFPVDVKAGELPSEEMYMSGRSLFPLTAELAHRITDAFDGKLRISYSGGADFFNIRKIYEAGIWPVTMATTVLKPGGYQRFSQISTLFLHTGNQPFAGVNPAKAAALAEYARSSPRSRKPVKPLPEHKNGAPLPLLNCFSAPCRGNCPIGQDIPAYLRAMEEGDAKKALEIILERNAMPFTTGTLCPQTCADHCMRSHYEEAVHIRAVKLLAAQQGYPLVTPELAVRRAESAGGRMAEKKVAVIGGGPAGLSAAYFLSRAGVPVTVYEKREHAGGVPRYVIPSFRLGEDALDQDEAICTAYGAQLVTGREITSVQELWDEGFTDVIAAIGAWAPGRLVLQYGETLDALEFLQKAKADPSSLHLGRNVAVIGGGNTAMDTARAAMRVEDVEAVRLVYRRNRRYMSADEEELQMALEDGVLFCEQLAPVGEENGKLRCEVCRLGAPDASGRRRPEGTGEFCEIPADTVIAAVGERVEAGLYEDAGAALDRQGRPMVDENRMTTVPHLYAAGDGRSGPATVVRAIADAQIVAHAIAGVTYDRYAAENADAGEKIYLERKGCLAVSTAHSPDDRCLGCPVVCEVCADVCPNRANLAIRVPGMKQAQILHVDGMCNECGNCAVFCPYSGRPYRDKFTLFWSEEDFADSGNSGFLVTTGGVKVRLDGKVMEMDPEKMAKGDFETVRPLIRTVIREYPWLIPQPDDSERKECRPAVDG